MATKRFDDVAEKARALEAQAKKLRREAQAARTKAYADALVTVFPEVKDMGSAEEVLDFVKGLKPGTGHGTPDARAAGAADSGHVPTAEAGESSEAHGGFSGAAYQGQPCRVPPRDSGSMSDRGSRSRVRHGRARLGGQKAGVRRGRRSRPLAS